ncbi:MAG: hypothetical protein LBN02_01475 [Oscillospiraceae bacterium]|jgi:hypothetical protein|nr:hypothetical protein [Oscillospiraceae bacterium]
MGEKADDKSEYAMGLPQAHLIAYFDMLGYKKAVENNEKEYFGKFVRAMLSLHLNMHTVYATDLIRYLKEPIEYNPIKYKVFSDNIVLYCPFPSDNNSKNVLLYRMADSCLNIQCHFSRIGIPIRGAITVGNISANKDVIFGAGLIRAVDLERIAKYPRIIIDTIIETDNLSYVQVMHDGEWLFLDYLSYYYLRQANINRMPEKERKALEKLYENLQHQYSGIGNTNVDNHDYTGQLNSFLCRHKELVESMANNGEIVEKYNWLKSYHNAFAHDHGYEELTVI